MENQAILVQNLEFVWIEFILLKLKTENWKHYSKIIFKCVNSNVEPNFNEKVIKNEICGFHTLFMRPTELIKKKLKSQQLMATVHINSSRGPNWVGKKKKKKERKRGEET